MGTTAKIENGELTGADVLNRYTHTLGGDLLVVAVLGVEQVERGWRDLGVADCCASS